MTHESSGESVRRDEIRRLAEEFAQNLRYGGQPSIDAFLARVDTSLQDNLREKLVGEEFSHRFGDAAQDGKLRYRPIELLGKGRFGEVYKAVDEELNRNIALKVLLGNDDASKKRFLNEAHRQASLPRHAHLVAIYDAGKLSKGHPFVVMECLDGGTLRGKLQSAGKLDAETAAQLMLQIAQAVAEVHEGTSRSKAHQTPPLVHRDLKPENILLDLAGQAHVADFGLAAAVADLNAGAIGAGGTFRYMSPEQVTAFRPGMTPAPVDTRSDTWALGVILYELLTGKQPFVSHAPDDNVRRDELLDRITRDEPPQMRDLCPEVPPELERLVATCLKKDVTERVQLSAVVKQLQSWLDSMAAIPAPLPFSARLHEARRGFSDRPWLFDEVDAWSVAHTNERLLLLLGNPGSGKSAFLAELIHRNPEQRILAFHLCRHDWPESRSAARFVRSLAGMLATSVESYRCQLASLDLRQALRFANCERDPTSAFETAVVNPLSNAQSPGEGIFTVIVDGLDEAEVSSNASIVGLLAQWERRLPDWLRIVASVRCGAIDLALFSGARSVVIDRENSQHGADVQEDVARFLGSRLRRPNFEERLQQSGVTAKTAANRLLEKSETNFLYVAQALDAIERDLINFRQLEQLPPGLASLFADFFRRQWPNQERFVAVRPILEILVVAQEPLNEDLIASATGLDVYHLDERLNQLSQYLDRRQNTIRLRHQAIANWLSSTTGIYRVVQDEGHTKLANACWTEYENDVGSISAYSLQHLPAHLAKAGRWNKLYTVLEDIEFLQAKADAGHVVELGLKQAIAKAFLARLARRVRGRAEAIP